MSNVKVCGHVCLPGHQVMFVCLVNLHGKKKIVLDIMCVTALSGKATDSKMIVQVGSICN